MASSPITTPLPEERFGVTAPISVALPSQLSQECNQLFEAWINLQAPDETPEGYSRRYRVLVELGELALSYVRSIKPATGSGAATGGVSGGV